MLCLQASIGAVNDLADVEVDRVGKPGKAILAGLVTLRVARGWASGSLALGVLLALPSGVATALLAVAGLALGYLYDLRLSRTALSWLPLALALPLLPLFAWLGATGEAPSGLVALAPVAMLAGAALLVGNGVVDAERDRLAARSTVAVRIGRSRAWLAHAVALGLAVMLALLLAPSGPPAGGSAADGVGALRDIRSIGIPLGALAIAAGVVLLRAARPGLRERGWELEAIGTAILGLGWLAGTALVGSGGAGA
jgi:4-hydroxybenzoate polyprenyltransferase